MAKKKLTKSQQQLLEMKTQMANQAKELEDLKKQTTAITQTKSRSSPKKRRAKAKKQRAERENNELKSRIKEVIVENFWRLFKFVPPGEAQELRLFGMIRDVMIKEGNIACDFGATKRQEAAWKEDWPEDNASIIAAELNGHRNYVQSNLKGAARKYWVDNGETLPPVAKILACARRTIDLDDPEDVRIFTWYWDSLLPQVTGNNRDWQPGIRHYATISTAAPKDAPSKLYMTPSHEAFAATHYNSYRNSWIEQWNIKKQWPGFGIIHAKNRGPGVTNNVEYVIDEHEKKIRCFAAKFKSKWTNSDSGAGRIGGWKQEGKKEYQDLLKQVKAARKIPENLEMEQQFLDLLRADHGLTANSHEEERRKKRRKTNNDSPVAGDDDSCFDEECDDYEPEDDDDDDDNHQDGDHENGDGAQDDDSDAHDENNAAAAAAAPQDDDDASQGN